MIRYLNWKGPQGRETIDEFDSTGMPWREARAERARLVDEYAMAGMPGAYWSSRMCANWRT
jgi:hypothetical protein